jgi:hypothetical protein
MRSLFRLATLRSASESKKPAAFPPTSGLRAAAAEIVMHFGSQYEGQQVL